jgi:YfiH family protein
VIRPPGFRGAAFGEAAEGDLRVDEGRRRHTAATLGIPPEWAFVSQVHGSTVVRAAAPGTLGEADAIYTTRQALPIAVATADCVPVVLEGPGFAAVIHAGWRGASSGVLQETIATLTQAGLAADRAAIGPGIGPCCYEVGEDVAERFAGYASSTTWGTTSVDIAGYLESILDPLPVWRSERCTYTDDYLNSYRRNRTKLRQVAVAWLPPA